MFKCEFPNCDYITESRSSIHLHHIIPKTMNGINGRSNRIYLCPNCHSKIYVPGCEKGIHSIKHKDSIIIEGWKQSTSGRILQYINSNGSQEFSIN